MIVSLFSTEQIKSFNQIIKLKDKIYVCGGFDGSSRHSTMEYYEQSTDKWTLLDSTSVGREGAGLVSLGFYFKLEIINNKIILNIKKR